MRITTLIPLLTATLLLVSAPLAAAEPPNFVFILADDLGYGDLGCYGSKEVKTPHIDKLAADGVRFTDYHSNGAVCSPTRAAFLTGRYQQRSGVEGVVTAKSHRKVGLPIDEVTFADALKGRGYATAVYGKWHVGYESKFGPLRQGFDDFVGFVSGNVDYHAHIDQTGVLDWWKGERIENEPGYITDLITDYSTKFIAAKKDSPFCLYVAHGSPHYPYQGRKDPAERKVGEGNWRRKHPDISRRYREMIETLDESVGRIRAAVDKAGLSERTMIVFLSDNGPVGKNVPIASAGPLRGRKGSLWEGGHRVPGIACWPSKIRAGRESSVTTLGMDWLPTMLELAGAAMPKDRIIDGVDLSGLLLRNTDLANRDLFWRTGNARAIRRGPWKLIITKGQNPALFHLGRDIGESKDVSAQEPAAFKALSDALEAWHRNVAKGVAKVSG